MAGFGERVFWERVNYSAGLKHARELIERIFSDEDISGKSVIDIGCGTGTYSLIFKEKGARGVTGVDFSGPSIDAARKETGKRGLEDIQFLNVDIKDYALEGQSFDLVMCHGMIYYVSSPHEVMERLCALAAQNGVIFISFIKNTRYAKIINSIRKILYHIPKTLWGVTSLLISSLFFSILFIFHKERDFSRIRTKVLAQYYPIMNYFHVTEAVDFFSERGFKAERVMHSLDTFPYGTEFGLKLRRS